MQRRWQVPRRQAAEWQRLAGEIETAKDQLNEYKATLNDINSTSAYDEDAVKSLEGYSQATDKAAEATKKTGEALKTELQGNGYNCK